MATISALLQQLIDDKTTLVNNLNTKGVSQASDLMTYTELVPLVLDIQTGNGLDTSDATAKPEDILAGEVAYAKGEKVIGNIPSKPAQTYIPNTNDQEIPSGQYLSGNQTIKGDGNLLPQNIRENITIFGVQGNLKDLDTSDANATPADIKYGLTAYVNGEKITGSAYTRGAVTAVVDGQQHWLKEGFYTGGITIPGDINLKASNIKKDVVIYGVTGILDENMNLDTSDATATAEDILEGKTAYVDGTKITGTYVPPTTTEYNLIDTRSFSSVQDTLNAYGNTVYISEDGGQTFRTLQVIYDSYRTDESGNPSEKNYIVNNTDQQYGIMMDNWSAGGSMKTSILFADPLKLKSSAFFMSFYCSLSTWMNVTMHIHLYKAKNGTSAAEKLADVQQQIANKESGVWNGDLTYLGAANKTQMYLENETIDFESGDYYLYIDGFEKNGQTNMTLIRVRLLDI